MPRGLTAQERIQAKQFWPKMNVAAVVVTGAASTRYNCLAWTLGITTSWIWPWQKPNVAKIDFDGFYVAQGFVPAATGPIAVFGLNPNLMAHGSLSGPGHGPRWESKCGAWLRIQHGLAEMEGGSLYGNVLGFYARAIQTKRAAGARAMKPAKLSREELRFIQARVGQVDSELKDRFRRAYQAWKEACQHPLIAIDSNPVSRTHTPEFRELISLGPEILPLLMEKLTDVDEFFALQAVDRLLRPEFVVSSDIHDPAVLNGEQGRALATLKQWIKTQA